MNQPNESALTSTIVEEKPLTPSELHSYTGTLYVRNLSTSKIIHTDEDKGNVVFILGPRGTEDQYSILPKEVAASIGFQRLWRRGHVMVTNDPKMEGILAMQDARALASYDEHVRDIHDSITETSGRNALEAHACLVCGEMVQISAKQLESVPPLCDVHGPKANEYISTTSEVDGKIVTQWAKH